MRDEGGRVGSKAVGSEVPRSSSFFVFFFFQSETFKDSELLALGTLGCRVVIF
jgi:hypothetical protein